MSPHVKRLADLLIDLVQQLSESSVVLDQRHFRLLLHLSSVEKITLAKTVLEWSWNVGSPTIMKFLQKTHILSMTDLIVHKFNHENAESAQLIFGDLLETDAELLADLLIHTNSSDQTGLLLCEVLNEGFKRLIIDTFESPCILANNYLEEVEELLNDECFEDVRLMHLKLFIENGPKYSVVEALCNHNKWNNDAANDHPVFKSFLMSILGRGFAKRLETFKQILSKCDDWNMDSWKCVLLLLQIVVDAEESKTLSTDEQNKFKAVAKKFVKDTLKRCISEEDENGLYVLFLVSRQIIQSNESLLGNYAHWFKNTFGEMKYVLKAAEFTTVLTMLAGMVPMESNLDYLDVHFKTYLPAPTRCNQLVLNYKQLCTSRHMHLSCPTDANTNKSTVIADEDVLLIDDD